MAFFFIANNALAYQQLIPTAFSRLIRLGANTMIGAMSTGAVTISIDLELAWGNWDNLERHHIEHVERSERMIVKRLIEILDRYEIPVTWALVAALLDRASAKGREGGERNWYAPDVIDTIRAARVAHDLGSHGGHHRYLNGMSDAEADEDLSFARSIHDANGLPFRSFVFPRNLVGKTQLLEKHGAKVYRGQDRAWHERIRSRQMQAGRIANLVDKMLPIAPETVAPERDHGLVNLPGSLLFMGRDGVRRYARPGTMRRKLAKGVAAASREGRVFHLWFHPSNFWHDTDSQFATFESFIAGVSDCAGRGEIEVKPMAAFA